MRFKAKKVYGNSKVIDCPFCGKQATAKNEQEVDVCSAHTKALIQEGKCVCGTWLELRSGKYGPYFNCLDCGNINFQKGLELCTLSGVDQKKSTQEVTSSSRQLRTAPAADPQEMTISTDDVEYFS